MTRQQFCLLVIINQFLYFGFSIVQSVSDSRIPPELMELAVPASSLMDSAYAAILEWRFLFWAATVATLTGAVGLCLGRRWGRSLYTMALVLSILTIPFSPIYVDTGWTIAVGALEAITAGMIVALAYFSHLKRIFEGSSGNEQRILSEFENSTA